MKKLVLAIALGLSVQNSQAFYIEKPNTYYATLAIPTVTVGALSTAIVKANNGSWLNAIGAGSLGAAWAFLLTIAIFRDRFVYNVISDSTALIKNFQSSNREVVNYLLDGDFDNLITHVDSLHFSNYLSQDPRIFAYESYIRSFRELDNGLMNLQRLVEHDAFGRLSDKYKQLVLSNVSMIKSMKKALSEIVNKLTNMSDWPLRMANEMARKKMEQERAQHRIKMDLEREKIHLEREKIEVQKERNKIYRGKKV